MSRLEKLAEQGFKALSSKYKCVAYINIVLRTHYSGMQHNSWISEPSKKVSLPSLEQDYIKSLEVELSGKKKWNDLLVDANLSNDFIKFLEIENLFFCETDYNKVDSIPDKIYKEDLKAFFGFFFKSVFYTSNFQDKSFIILPQLISKLNGDKTPIALILLLINKNNLSHEEFNELRIYVSYYFKDYLEYYYLELVSYTQTRSAINQILIDSYAHNISAHSLNFLQQLFNYRNENYLKKTYHLPVFGRLENLPLNTVSYSDFFDSNIANHSSNDNLKYYEALGKADQNNTIFDANLLDYILYTPGFPQKNKDTKVPASNLLEYAEGEGKLPMPLDYAIAPLLTYLRDKGAFWSGIIRDNEATPSRIVSMYDLLMEMFNNPLFLGSIMAAEEFYIIHIFINAFEDNVIYEASVKDKQEDQGGEQEDKAPRHFLTINIKEFVEEEMKNTKEERKDSNEGKKKENGEQSSGAEEQSGEPNEDTQNGSNASTEKGTESPYHFLNEGRYSNMNFIRYSEDFEVIREILEKKKILLPGGDVGKHAFFTIVENTLRNAKHIKQDHREAIKKNGLELHFQITEEKFQLTQSLIDELVNPNDSKAKEEIQGNRSLIQDLRSAIQNGKDINSILMEKVGAYFNMDNKKIAALKTQELYKIGISVNYRYDNKEYLESNTAQSCTELQNLERKLINSVVKNSFQSILNEKGEPRMGGSSQDKVCAAALFGKTFTSAEYPHKEVEYMYPWITYNLAPDEPGKKLLSKHRYYEDEVRKIETKEQRQQHFKSDVQLIDFENQSDDSFIKDLYVKFLLLWKAKNEVFNDTIEETNNQKGRFIDTIPRFKIAVVKDDESKKVLRKRAVIRVVQEAINTGGGFANVYKEWNGKWGTNMDLFFEKNGKKYKLEKDMQLNENDTFSNNSIKIDHDVASHNPDVCKLRNHGYFLKYFFNTTSSQIFDQNWKDNRPNDEKKALYQELLETINTQITIIDDRLFNVIDGYKFDGFASKLNDATGIFPKGLNLHIFNEEKKINYESNGIKSNTDGSFKELCDQIKERINTGKHFFIFHLSFVDNLIANKVDDITDYNLFIEKWFEKAKGLQSKNCIIGMTSGRGRTDWLDKLDADYKPYCIHVPIESLQTAIQQGVLFKDDFDIKYNLCKVLFGS